ncbi:hypothetical protein [Pseudomonas sp. NPDC008258]|uniref:hypothetical protein n=1 Tax=Pseudomonas sp. NPDC008258 TaxID=3364418 RepID=UPI0036E28FD8
MTNASVNNATSSPRDSTVLLPGFVLGVSNCSGSLNTLRDDQRMDVFPIFRLER